MKVTDDAEEAFNNYKNNVIPVKSRSNLRSVYNDVIKDSRLSADQKRALINDIRTKYTNSSKVTIVDSISFKDFIFETNETKLDISTLDSLALLIRSYNFKDAVLNLDSTNFTEDEKKLINDVFYGIVSSGNTLSEDLYNEVFSKLDISIKNRIRDIVQIDVSEFKNEYKFYPYMHNLFPLVKIILNNDIENDEDLAKEDIDTLLNVRENTEQRFRYKSVPLFSNTIDEISDTLYAKLNSSEFVDMLQDILTAAMEFKYNKNVHTYTIHKINDALQYFIQNNGHLADETKSKIDKLMKDIEREVGTIVKTNMEMTVKTKQDLIKYIDTVNGILEISNTDTIKALSEAILSNNNISEDLLIGWVTNKVDIDVKTKSDLIDKLGITLESNNVDDTTIDEIFEDLLPEVMNQKRIKCFI
jgi:hypothetical protein